LRSSSDGKSLRLYEVRSRGPLEDVRRWIAEEGNEDDDDEVSEAGVC
jgi:hypothetical protein